MGWESFPHYAGRDGDGVRQNHVGWGRRPHPSTPPHPTSLSSLIIDYHSEKGRIGFRPCGLGFAKRLHINLRVAQSIPQSYLNGTKSSSTAALIESIDFLFCSLRVGQFCPVWLMDKQPQFYHFSPFFYSLFFNPTIHC